MAHCLSCFRKRSDAGIDADVPPKPHRPNNKDKTNESKIAPPSNIVPFEINGPSRINDNTQKDQIHAFDGQGEKTSEQVLFPEPRLKTETRTDFRNLWEVAEQRLDESYKKWLNCEASLPIEKVIEQIQIETKENYKRLEKHELGAREKKQGSFNARAKFKNLLGFTLQAQDLIGAVVGFDPTGYASTAWSIVSFGLTLLQKDIERHDLVVGASEYLAGVLSYHTIIDNNYRLKYAQANEGLEDALVEVYCATLKYAAEVIKAKMESPGRRFCNNITALVENPLEDLKACVDSMSAVVDRWKSLVRDEDQTKKIDGILGVLKEEVIIDLREISSRARSDEELKILDWLSSIQYSKPQNDKQRNRSSNTGNWILESNVYADWKETPGELLWLRGAVGCGKSYLCSTIIHDIKQHCGKTFCDALAYWYFDFSDEKTQYVENMVRCLLRQLASNPLPGFMQEWWDDHRRNKEPEYARLLDALHSVIQNLPGDLFVVFDALDECPQEPKRERDSLLQFMEDLMDKHPKKLHFLATSRPEPDILEKLQNYRAFDLEAHLGEDVEKFIKTQLKHGRLKRWQSGKPPLLQRIENKLLDIPERRFRWADLQIKRLEECHKREDIEKALVSVPESLEESYQHVLLNINSKDQPQALKILTWLSFSLAPLTLQAIQTIVELEISDSVIEICTTSLVTINAENIIRLAHFSVKEFLLSEYARKEVGFFYLSAQPAHGLILTKLLAEIYEYSNIRLNEFNSKNKPLLDYAARFWDGHMKQFCGSSPPGDLQETIDHIFLHQQCYSNWIRLRARSLGFTRWYMPFSQFHTPLAMASEFGLERTAKIFLKKGINPNHTDNEHYTNAYELAARGGHLALLALLLEAPWKPRDPRSILYHIDDSKEGKPSLELVFTKLWELGVLVDLRADGTDQIPQEEVVLYAAANAKCGLTLFRLLLGSIGFGVKFDLNLFLCGAARSSHPHETLRMVLDRLDEGIGSLDDGFEELTNAITDPELARRWFQVIVRSDYWESNHIHKLARNLNLELMEVFLEIYGNEIVVTDDVLSAAAENKRDSKIFGVFLQSKPPETVISDYVFYAAAGNLNRSQGLSIFKAALDSCGPDRLIQDYVLSEIISRKKDSTNMLGELFRRKQAVSVSERVLLDAAWKGNLKNFQLLVAIGGLHISITEKMLIHALSGTDFRSGTEGHSLTEYVIGLLGPDYLVTEEVLIHAARNTRISQSTVSLLLDRSFSSIIPEGVFINAYDNPLFLETLLDRAQNKAPVQNIMQRIANDRDGNHHRAGGGGVLQVLIRRGLVFVNEQLVETFAEHQNALKVILIEDPMVRCTQRAFENANRFECIHTLLKFKNSNFSVSDDFVKSLLSSAHVVNFYGNREKTLRLLLDRFESKMPITEEILLHAANSRPYSEEMIRLFLDERRPLDLQAFWESVWQSCCASSEQISDTLLEYTALEVSQRMLERVPNFKPLTSRTGSSDNQRSSDPGSISGYGSTSYLESTSDLEGPSDLEILRWNEAHYEVMKIKHDFLARLVWFLVERNFTVPQDVMSIIVEKGHLKTIAVVFYHNPHITVTDELLIAARKNTDYYDIMWFLSMFSEPPKTVEDTDDAGHIIHWPQDSRKCHLSSCRVIHSADDRYERYEHARWPLRSGFWTV